MSKEEYISNLIREARRASRTWISHNSYIATLLKDLADNLEMACRDMKYGIENVGCYVCAKEMPDGYCDVCEFEWVGGAE